MKKILVINKELPELENNRYIRLKKNKTIIKDYKLMNPEFYSRYDYKFFLEEWEVWTDEKIHICFSNNFAPLKPVHIISDTNPKDGIKCLYQTEKMLLLKMCNGTFEISKWSINEIGDITTSVINVGTYKKVEDVKNKINNEFRIMYTQVLKTINKYKKEGYLAPIYASI